MEDTPRYLNYGMSPFGAGENDHSEYREGVFVGYRYYTSKKMPVLFPFGHGLSYTTFSYGNLTVGKESLKDTEELEVTLEVTNTGKRAGKEVVQLYVSAKDGRIIRPVRELREFAKVSLEPGVQRCAVRKLSILERWVSSIISMIGDTPYIATYPGSSS